ncbi:hypothetical protein LV78_007241 [Actinosynnema pretiosum]|nr:hypothetical protein [Actinosynnema pretiosum]
MWEDDELRAALRAEVEGPDPRPATGLDEVLRRGRRRVLLHRTGAVAAAFALVGGAALGIGSLKGLAQQSSPADSGLTTITSAPTTTTAPPVVLWPQVNVPARTPKSTFSSDRYPPPAGWKVLTPEQCDGESDPSWTEDESAYPLSGELATTLVRALQLHSGKARVGEFTQVKMPRRPWDIQDGYSNWTDLSDEEGAGSIALVRGHYPQGLTPTQAADQELFGAMNCAPPRRATLENGVVVQYYETTVHLPHQSLIKNLRVYHPSGAYYVLVLRNYSSKDFRVSEEQGAFDRFGAGRETLPLDEARLQAIGEELARTAKP